MEPDELPVDDSCNAWQADDIKILEFRSSSPSDNYRFHIAFESEFLYPPAFPMVDEDDYLLVLPDFESSTSFRSFWAPCNFLDSGNLSWNQISTMLTHIGVPLHKQPFMVHHISSIADEIAGKEYNKKQRVLPIMVSISVVVDYYVAEQEDSNTIATRQASEFSQLRRVPANEASIQALEKVEIQESCEIKQQCMVCLDKMKIGDEVRSMPCKHAYHENCIFNWLRVCGFCPICRFQLPG